MSNTEDIYNHTNKTPAKIMNRTSNVSTETPISLKVPHLKGLPSKLPVYKLMGYPKSDMDSNNENKGKENVNSYIKRRFILRRKSAPNNCNQRTGLTKTGIKEVKGGNVSNAIQVLAAGTKFIVARRTLKKSTQISDAIANLSPLETTNKNDRALFEKDTVKSRQFEGSISKYSERSTKRIKTSDQAPNAVGLQEIVKSEKFIKHTSQEKITSLKRIAEEEGDSAKKKKKVASGSEAYQLVQQLEFKKHSDGCDAALWLRTPNTKCGVIRLQPMASVSYQFCSAELFGFIAQGQVKFCINNTTTIYNQYQTFALPPGTKWQAENITAQTSIIAYTIIKSQDST